MTCKQQTGQSLDDLQKLRQLSRDCDYKAVTAGVYRNEAIRDVFISGISSIPIRLRLLENTSEESMKLDAVFSRWILRRGIQKISTCHKPPLDLKIIHR